MLKNPNSSRRKSEPGASGSALAWYPSCAVVSRTFATRDREPAWQFNGIQMWIWERHRARGAARISGVWRRISASDCLVFASAWRMDDASRGRRAGVGPARTAQCMSKHQRNPRAAGFLENGRCASRRDPRRKVDHQRRQIGQAQLAAEIEDDRIEPVAQGFQHPLRSGLFRPSLRDPI